MPPENLAQYREALDYIARDEFCQCYVFGVRFTVTPEAQAAINPGDPPSNYKDPVKKAEWRQREIAKILSKASDTMFAADLTEIQIRPIKQVPLSRGFPVTLPLAALEVLAYLMRNRRFAVFGVNAPERVACAAAWALKAQRYLCSVESWRQPTYGYGVLPLLADPVAFLLRSSRSAAEYSTFCAHLGIFQDGQSLEDELKDVEDLVIKAEISRHIAETAARL